jgi:histidinol-phosphatase (PHP family)
MHSKDHDTSSKFQTEEMISQAIKDDFKLIAFTDHFYLPEGVEDQELKKAGPSALTQPEFKKAYKLLQNLKEKYKSQIEVIVGVELDYLPTLVDWTLNELSKFDFDYILGSVHFVYSKKIDKYLPVDFSKKEFEKACDAFGGAREFVSEYFENVKKLAELNLSDAIGHLDLVKKFNSGSEYFDESAKQVEALLDVIKKNGRIVEINTSGWDKECSEPYPSKSILEKIKARDIGITIGSDAHAPEKVNNRIEQGLNLAKTIGFKQLIYFKSRQKNYAEIK